MSVIASAARFEQLISYRFDMSTRQRRAYQGLSAAIRGFWEQWPPRREDYYPGIGISREWVELPARPEQARPGRAYAGETITIARYHRRIEAARKLHELVIPQLEQPPAELPAGRYYIGHSSAVSQCGEQLQPLPSRAAKRLASYITGIEVVLGPHTNQPFQLRGETLPPSISPHTTVPSVTVQPDAKYL